MKKGYFYNKKLLIVLLSSQLFSMSLEVSNISTWITPNSKVCIDNGGEFIQGGCKSNWDIADNICTILNGKLPTIIELKEVVTSCGGLHTQFDDSNHKYIENKNRVNNSYQECYQKKGFIYSTSNYYWSSDIYLYNYNTSWTINFTTAVQSYNDKENSYYVNCIEF